MTKTLLVDGNNLLKIGFHGVKDFFNKGEHVGGIWHFLNTVRRFLEENNYNKKQKKKLAQRKKMQRSKRKVRFK
mgnify:CR=1 FL=1